jgi:hypothetical protein
LHRPAGRQENMTINLLNVLLAPFLLATFHTIWQQDTVAIQEPHAECIEQAVGNHEIVTSQSLDVDQEGSLEELIFYKNDYLLAFRLKKYD